MDALKAEIALKRKTLDVPAPEGARPNKYMRRGDLERLKEEQERKEKEEREERRRQEREREEREREERRREKSVAKVRRVDHRAARRRSLPMYLCLGCSISYFNVFSTPRI